MDATKLTLVLNNKGMDAGMMIPAYMPERFGIKRDGNNTIISFVLMFYILRQPDHKKRLHIKCEGEFSISKQYEKINMKDIYDQFKKGANHIADWIIENEVTSVRPVFPSLDKFSPYLKKLWDDLGLPPPGNN